MGVSRYNSEGYYDPTAYEALTKIVQEEKAARYRPLVYICSPYSGDTEGNTEKARRYSRFAAEVAEPVQEAVEGGVFLGVFDGVHLGARSRNQLRLLTQR